MCVPWTMLLWRMNAVLCLPLSSLYPSLDFHCKSSFFIIYTALGKRGAVVVVVVAACPSRREVLATRMAMTAPAEAAPPPPNTPRSVGYSS